MTSISPVNPADLEELVDLMRTRRTVVLAGAGCSTDSGIPDYRGPQGSLRKRKPMTYQEFLKNEDNRARYWSRSTVGWARMARVEPNATHLALAELEAAGAVAGIITQNVDGLHQQAGSSRVVELHGALRDVRCLTCGQVEDRADYQERLHGCNLEWTEQVIATIGGPAEKAPDGDAELPAWTARDFVVPACIACDGVMKPDVVFFGESVPASRVEDAWALFNEGELLLVLGSSLTVYSGRRFIYRAVEEAKPIAVVNLGPTRADEFACARVDAALGSILPHLSSALAPPSVA